MPNVLSPRDLVSRPDDMDETVPDTYESHLEGSSDNRISDNNALIEIHLHELVHPLRKHAHARYSDFSRL